MELLKRKKTMNAVVQKFVTAFGMCVITASLCSGCATGAPPAQSVSFEELNTYQIDCRKKEEQIKFLTSLRRSADDRLFTLDGWFGVNDRINWVINYHLVYINQYC